MNSINNLNQATSLPSLPSLHSVKQTPATPETSPEQLSSELTLSPELNPKDFCTLQPNTLAAPGKIEALTQGGPVAYFGAGYKIDELTTYLREQNQTIGLSAKPFVGSEQLSKMSTHELKTLKTHLEMEIVNPFNCDDRTLQRILKETDKTLQNKQQQPANRLEKEFNIPPDMLM